MYTVLIVDDELRSRKGLRDSINWAQFKLDVIGEASNGLEARDFIMEHQPNIVICDVMMPHLDGLAMVSDIRDLYPSIQYIFLSGYSQTKYLRKAMSLSAIDYIIKPFSIKEMEDALQRAINQVKKQRIHEHAHSSDLALEIIHMKDQSLIHLNDLPIKLDEQLLSFVIAITESVDASYNTLSDQAVLIYDLKNKVLPDLNKLLASLFADRFLISQLNNSFIVHVNIKPEHKNMSLLISDLNRLLSIFKPHEDQVCIGISSVYTGQENMLTAYREARDARKLAFLRNYGKVISLPTQEVNRFRLRDEFPEHLINTLKSKSSANAFSLLDNYLLEMSRADLSDISIVLHELMSIGAELSKALTNLGQNTVNISEKIYYAQDLAQIRSFLNKLMNEYNEHVNNLDSVGRSVLDIEKYIRENFQNNITIADIAEKVYVTPNYLSFLYKNRTGKTINQYIQECRMEEARRLLSESHLKIGTIAKQLGFANQNYFTRLFTKTQGDTPSQYRSKYARSVFQDEEDDV